MNNFFIMIMEKIIYYYIYDRNNILSIYKKLGILFYNIVSVLKLNIAMIFYTYCSPEDAF